MNQKKLLNETMVIFLDHPIPGIRTVTQIDMNHASKKLTMIMLSFRTGHTIWNIGTIDSRFYPERI